MKVCPDCQRTYDDDAAFCQRDGAQLIAQTDQLIGQVLDGQYEIEAFIGAGRTGKVYRARNILLDNVIALKMLDPHLCRDAQRQRHLLLDARAFARLHHPNVTSLYDLKLDTAGRAYVVMEYVEGQSLDGALRVDGRLDTANALAVLTQIARALDYAHECGILYRYLKPADVMLARASESRLLIKLLPPSFAPTAPSNDDDKLGIDAATAPYSAPEVWVNAADGADARADIYSLGVICYELLSGRKPFEGQSVVDIARQHLSGQSLPLAEFSRAVGLPVALAVEHALAIKRAERPATAGQFIAELQSAFGYEREVVSQSPLKMANPIEVYPLEQAAPAENRAELDGSRQTRGLVIEPPGHLPPTTAAASRSDAELQKPLYADENVQFTVYRPEVIAAERWYKLLAFAHLSERRADAAPDEPDPVEQVKRIAGRVLADEPARYEPLKQDSLHAVPHKGEITFVPVVEGCEFNPPSQSFFWQQSVHKVEFDVRAAAVLEGRTARGRLTVFLGSLIWPTCRWRCALTARAATAHRRSPPCPLRPRRIEKSSRPTRTGMSRSSNRSRTTYRCSATSTCAT